MSQQTAQQPAVKSRESSSFTGPDFDRLVAFANERGWQEKPFAFVVQEWNRRVH